MQARALGKKTRQQEGDQLDHRLLSWQAINPGKLGVVCSRPIDPEGANNKGQ